ncbi:ABA4-like family protein [Herpetosiphon llansteffanensis]|uniref:ABA4-like family protein n=1 Tax=Herpetosiphon llansteffanensis TaxID=2094568 RepID=UPI000D7C5C7D|nr:ABA4-like family protein [Herpetosiphon llansteffanensis]
MMAQLFSLSSLFVMPFWFLMVVLPFWKWTQRIIQSPWLILGPALIYVIVLVPVFGTVWTGVSNPTLPGIIELIGNETGATLSWVHFLAFDLFVGRWIYLDSRERNIFAPITSLILISVLMIGPAGFLIYMVVRTIHGLVRSAKTTPVIQTVAK